MVINKECLYIYFFIVDFLLKIFILQSLANYIFIFIVEFGIDFDVEKSVDFVDFFKKSTLNIGYPWGRFFMKKNRQPTFNFLSKIMVIIDKNEQKSTINFFEVKSDILKKHN
jgi:hypothetical protein